MHHQNERPPDPRRAAKGVMRVVVRKEPLSALSDYGSVPIAFSTTTVLEVEWIANGLGGVRMVEAPLGQPLTKDFDGDEPVMSWHRFGDISHWGIFAACRFYAKRGLHLGGVRRGVYPQYPDEVQLLWYLDLRSGIPRPSGQPRTE